MEAAKVATQWFPFRIQDEDAKAALWQVEKESLLSRAFSALFTHH